jgi:hypothetical protein
LCFPACAGSHVATATSFRPTPTGALLREQRPLHRQARERQRALARERTGWLLRYFETHPCLDCGETGAVVLEFDHRRDRAFNIGSVLPYRNWEMILTEIEK